MPRFLIALSELWRKIYPLGILKDLQYRRLCLNNDEVEEFQKFFTPKRDKY